MVTIKSKKPTLIVSTVVEAPIPIGRMKSNKKQVKNTKDSLFRNR